MGSPLKTPENVSGSAQCGDLPTPSPGGWLVQAAAVEPHQAPAESTISECVPLFAEETALKG
jgi:hypothetical protein